MYCLY